MGQDTAKGNGGADQGIELFVTANGELQVARGDALDLEVLGSVLWEEEVASVYGDSGLCARQQQGCWTIG